MKIILVSKYSLDIEQYAEFKMSVLISLSKSLISLRWVTFTQWSFCISSWLTSKSHELRATLDKE